MTSSLAATLSTTVLHGKSGSSRVVGCKRRRKDVAGELGIEWVKNADGFQTNEWTSAKQSCKLLKQ